MKVTQIRQSVFETNSSSTHSLTICSKEEFEQFKNGVLKLYRYKLVEVTDENSDDEDFQSHDDYFDDESLETFKKEYTTKSGDAIVVFGK